MHIERRNVDGVAEPPGYAHIAEVTSGRLIFLAGQVPLNELGELVGSGDAVAQTIQCLKNLDTCLKTAGARPSDAVRTTVYVVAREQEVMSSVWQVILDSEIGDVARTAATLLGVERLGYTGQLVEIEVTLAVD